MGIFNKKIETTKMLFKCPKCGYEKEVDIVDPTSGMRLGLIASFRSSKKKAEMAEKEKKETICPKCGVQMVLKGA